MDEQRPPQPPGTPAESASGDDADAQGLDQPWVRFAVLFVLLVAAAETFYHAVVLKSDAFYSYLSMLATLTSIPLTPFFEQVSLTGARVQTEHFTVTVDYGCDGLQISTLLSAAILAFPAPWKHKLIGLIAGNLWMQSWNIARIATLVVIGGIDRAWFHPTHVYLWPAILVVICMATWMYWARWTMSHDEPAEGI